MIIGYLRVSTGKQNPANQQDEIRRFADSRNLSVSQWVTEVASGKKKGCDRKLGGLIRRMKRGDTLIVTEVSRLSRTLTTHGHHGQVSGEGNQPLHNQGGVFVRQLHQQQGTLFRVRSGSGN